MTYHYIITQDGAEVRLSGTDDKQLREKAHRIARKSLDTGKGAVTITRNGREIAVLTQNERVASGEMWG